MLYELVTGQPPRSTPMSGHSVPIAMLGWASAPPAAAVRAMSHRRGRGDSPQILKR